MAKNLLAARRSGHNRPVHELLIPDRPTRQEAAERCRRALRERWRGASLAARALGRSVPEEVLALVSWFELLRALDEEERGVEEARGVVRDLEEGEPRSAIAVLLRPTVSRYSLSLLDLLAPAHERARPRGVFDTRSELVRHARRLVDPEVRALLRVLGMTGERDEVLARSLALGLQGVRWIRRLPVDVARGRIHLPMDELRSADLNVFELPDALDHKDDLRARRIVADEVQWARGELAKGWPLTRELGWRRGRLLAFWLRWNAATLSAVEANGYRVGPRGVPAGWLRLGACAVAAAASPRSPFRGSAQG